MPLEGRAKVDYQREYMRERRGREAKQRSLALAVGHAQKVEVPEDAAECIIDWCPNNLRVPNGRLQSAPFFLGDWQADWLRGAFAPGIFEAGLSVARKNGKSGVIAAALLCYLAGPLARPNWRAIVVSLTGALAKELRDAIQLTALASGMNDDIRVWQSPTPGRIQGRYDSRVDFLAADKSSGHAVGADLAIIDEAGLLPEKKRCLLYTSPSPRDS